MAVTMMDTITALLILTYGHPLLVARLGIFYQIFSNPSLGAWLMITASAFAAFGLTQQSRTKRFLLFFPQQIFLIMTSGSALDFIVLQHYADGVDRAWQFILQDQLPTIILTIAYFYAILDFKKKIVYNI